MQTAQNLGFAIFLCYTKYNKSKRETASGKASMATKFDIEKRIEHRFDALGKPTAHYSDAVSFGGILYLAGLLPLDQNGSLVGADDITAQAEQVFRNIRAGLEQVGCSFDDVLKITVYLTSVQDRGKVDAVRRASFGTTKPASTLVEISALAVPGAKIEIEAIAALRK
jgi:reactive intermediate/imine deaminase